MTLTTDRTARDYVLIALLTTGVVLALAAAAL